MTPPAVPTVDLADLATDDAARRDRAVDVLRDAFGRLGLVAVAGHGLPPGRVDGLFDALAAFVALPEDRKRPLFRPDLWFQRGWTPPDTERAVVAGGQPDFKECYFAAPRPVDPALAAAWPELYCDNQWSPDTDALEPAILSVGDTLHGVGEALLTGVEQTFELPPGTLTGLLPGAAHLTRALHYLPLTEAQADRGVLWGEEHTDFNLLTVLGGGRFQDAQGRPCASPDPAAGLWLRARPDADHPHGQLLRGAGPPGTLVAQVGQQLEILTGGRLTATPHVIRAPKVPGLTRSSVAHFVHVHGQTVLQPLPPFRDDATVEAYRPPVLAGTYAVKTLVDIGLAPETALQGLGFRQQARLTEARAAGA